MNLKESPVSTPWDALDVKLDLFVIAVGSDKVPDLVDQIIAQDAAETVMLIPGGHGRNP